MVLLFGFCMFEFLYFCISLFSVIHFFYFSIFVLFEFSMFTVLHFMYIGCIQNSYGSTYVLYRLCIGVI